MIDPKANVRGVSEDAESYDLIPNAPGFDGFGLGDGLASLVELFGGHGRRPPGYHVPDKVGASGVFLSGLGGGVRSVGFHLGWFVLPKESPSLFRPHGADLMPSKFAHRDFDPLGVGFEKGNPTERKRREGFPIYL
jgi:hypothetical protein